MPLCSDLLNVIGTNDIIFGLFCMLRPHKQKLIKMLYLMLGFVENEVSNSILSQK